MRLWTVLCFTAVLCGGCSSSGSTFLDRLQNPALAPSAFEDAIVSVRPSVIHQEWFEAYRLTFGGSFLLRFQNGEPGAVALLRGKGAPCGTGVTNGGVDAPVDFKPDPTLRGVLVLSASGSPQYQVDESRSYMLVADADGDGRTQELVRWRPYSDYDRPPFLIIHDLSHPGAPAMIAVELNPEAGRNSREYISETVDHGDGQFEVRVTSRLKLTPDRTGRWRFEPSSSGLRDIVIEEMIGGEFKQVARFTFDSRARRWTGPAGGSGHFWKMATDPWVGATYSDFSEKPR